MTTGLGDYYTGDYEQSIPAFLDHGREEVSSLQPIILSVRPREARNETPQTTASPATRSELEDAARARVQEVLSEDEVITSQPDEVVSPVET